MSKKVYLFANWKMYLNFKESLMLATDLVKKFSKLPKTVKIAVFPTALSLAEIKKVLKKGKISVGAQNVYWVDKGGYTGEISAAMYKEVGCEYALVGHSERRNLFHETNHEVRQKIEEVLNVGLTPVLCIGETLAENQQGLTKEIIETQLRAAFDGLNWPKGREVIIAYEPVWAIGTGESCDADVAEKIAALITKFAQGLLSGASLIVLYGGSVRSENISNYLSKPHLNGVLVGGASTKFSSWSDIIFSSKVKICL